MVRVDLKVGSSQIYPAILIAQIIAKHSSSMMA